jgi:TolB-like protein
MVVLIGVVIGAALLWTEFWQSQDERAISGSTAGASASKPSIAVLPFTNMSGDPEQEYFADGMTDDLITGLSKISGLLVIARNSTFKYKGIAADVSQVAREFGVRYVLEGSVRRDGQRLRINAQLIDASTGGHLWAERFDTSMRDIFAVQDKVTQSIVSALAVQLTAKEQDTRRGIETNNPEAYAALLRGQAHLKLSRWEDFAEAIANFEKALALDPGYSRVYGALAEVYWHVWSVGYSTELGMSSEDSFGKMEHYLAEAMKQPNPTAQAQHIRSRYLTKQGRFEEAVAAAERMVALNPRSEPGYRALGRAANKVGRPAQGLDAMRIARRINPRGDDTGSYAYRIAESYFLLGKYQEALIEFQESRKRSGDNYFSCMMLAGVYAQLGRFEEARVNLEKFNKERAKKGKPPHTLATFYRWAFVPSVRKRYVESLRMAGMPPGD